MIEVKNLHYRYDKNKSDTIKGIDFTIKEGEIFGFLGPSGAGKSTTQKILTKIIGRFEGEINIMNRPLQKWNSNYYEQIGVGFELPNHYLKLTAIENLRFFASFYDKKVVPPLKLLEMVGLEKAANQKVENYSKGMKMRLNFVRALMHEPNLIFFDEPTSGLDPVNARILKNVILHQKKEGKTVFITTHNMHDADELCDRVAFIVDGQIKIVDTPKQLKLKGGKRKVKVEYMNGLLRTAEFDLDGLGDNKQFIALLKKHNIQSIHTEEATLDDVFIKVTGATLN